MAQQIRVVFFGSTGFARKCIEKILTLPECDLIGIITTPECFSISYAETEIRNMLFADLSMVAQKRHIPVHIMEHGMRDSALLQILKEWRPDLMIACGWYHMFPARILDLAPVAAMHASLLPDYSGGAPLVWAMINGEERTGITLFFMDRGMDSGPIIGQATVPILFKDTITTLYAKIESAGLDLLQQYLPLIAAGKAEAVPQDESKRRVMPQRSPDDGEIDWSQPVKRLYDFVRAQTRPYPGAFTCLNRNKFFLWSATIGGSSSTDLPPGVLLVNAQASEVTVVCGDHRRLVVRQAGWCNSSVFTGKELVSVAGSGHGKILG